MYIDSIDGFIKKEHGRNKNDLTNAYTQTATHSTIPTERRVCDSACQRSTHNLKTERSFFFHDSRMVRFIRAKVNQYLSLFRWFFARIEFGRICASEKSKRIKKKKN